MRARYYLRAQPSAEAGGNQQKSAVAAVGERQFLGQRLGKRGGRGIGRKSLDRAKDRLREATRRNRGIALQRMVAVANRFIVGWVTYLRHAQCRSTLLELDGWLRRKLRCVRLKQCKSQSSIVAFLRENGVRERPARQLDVLGQRGMAAVGSRADQESDAERLVR